jgi:hypothetical protein
VRPKRKHPECAALEPSLVAYVHGEPHPRIPGLIAHLLRCEECRREEVDLRAVDAAIERALASAPAAASAWASGRAGLRLATPSSGQPAGWRRGRIPGWLAARAAPAAAAALIAGVLLLGKAPPPDRAPRAASVFGEPAAARARSFDGAELDGRLDWISFQLEGLGGDPW